ncbi:MAG: trypsin-like peptidase domain-containing protein [Candidatus Cloacimonetes bacterium]|nr:trypsin-like peptidase domain-containing protein [Candidatus Cloacimonadota bacterium]
MKDIMFAMGITFLGVSSAYAIPYDPQVSIADIVEDHGSSVVNIVVRSKAKVLGESSFGFHPLFGMMQRSPRRIPSSKGEGSGVIFDKSGLIITNSHVVDEADDILVVLSDGRKYNAVIKSKEKSQDIAILKIEDSEFKKDLSKDYVAKLGDSSELRVGEWVLAIGSPFSLEKTVTAGIVSAKGRSIHVDEKTQFNNLIQTDASINPGNSGGPLMNLKGEVVAINTAVNRQGQGLGFAIPINLVKRMIHDVNEFGEIKKSWLGVSVSNITQNMMPYLGVDSPNGVVIEKVVENTPAQKAGLLSGDVILSVNGSTVDNVAVLISKIQEIAIGDIAKFKIVRKSKTMFVEATMAEKGQTLSKAIGPSINSFGVKLKELNTSDRNSLKLATNTKGVVIDEVQIKSKAYQLGLRKNDVLIQFNRSKVNSVAQAHELMDKSNKNKLLAIVIRDGYLSYLEYVNQTNS